MDSFTPNGWAVLKPGSPRLIVGVIPGARRRMTVRNDQLGFLALFWAAFWNEKVEPLDRPGVGEPVDEGCYAYRDNTTAAGTPSEHAAAAAADLNWAKHPQGVPISKTFTPTQVLTIRRGVRYLNRIAKGTVAQWGGEWPSHPGSTAKTDGMHTQFVHGRVLYLVQQLAKTTRGKAVLKANPRLRIKGVTTR